MDIRHAAIAILPSIDLDRSEAFYARLGFHRLPADKPAWESQYRILYDAHGASLHLADGGAGLLVPGENPTGIYLYSEDVDALAREFGTEILEKCKRPENKPWGMYEFAVSDPDGALVRVVGPADCEARPFPPQV